MRGTTDSRPRSRGTSAQLMVVEQERAFYPDRRPNFALQAASQEGL